VPIHYNTWPLIAQETQAEPVILKPGESVQV
jgi:hypothetical protein